MEEGKYIRGGINPPPISKRPDIKLTGMYTNNKIDGKYKDSKLDYSNNLVIIISPRKSDKEYKLIYEYFNILYPFGWVVYLEGSNPPEILLSGEYNIDKNFDILEAKSRLQELQEEIVKSNMEGKIK